MGRGILRSGLLLLLAIVFLAGCGAKYDSRNSGDDEYTINKKLSSGEALIQQLAKEDVGPDTVNALSNPGQVRGFLDTNQIPHGDIYLQDGLLYINIVGLTEEIDQMIAAKYAEGTYKTVNVEYTLQELKAAQQQLADHDLYAKFNLYASGVDVIGNRVMISMPESSEALAKPEIEKLIDPKMISYHIESLSDKPHVIGTIVEVDAERDRILILEDGEENPSYYFSFNEHSELFNEAGEKIVYSDLKENQKVYLWYGGAVATSLPALATTRKLILVGRGE